jgi:arylsulfatase A-like enzyme
MLEIASLKGEPRQVAEFDGISLAPVLKDPKANMTQRQIYWHYPHYYQTTTPASAVRSGDWKLLEFFEDNRVELYNLKQDLGEKNNLAKRNPAKTAELYSLLSGWRKNVNAPMPRPNPDYREEESGELFMK